MDPDRFDRWTRSLVTAASRLAVLRAAALTAGGALGLVGRPNSAGAVRTLAAQCDAQFQANRFHFAANNERIGQAFTPSISGKLSRVEVVVEESDKGADDSPGTYILQIFAAGANGQPTGGALAKKEIGSGKALPGEPTVLAFNFGKRSAVRVEAQQRYAFILRRRGLEGYQVGGRSTNDCPFEPFRSFGGTFSSLSGAAPLDLVFRAFVGYD